MKNVLEYLEYTTSLYPSKIGVVCEERSITYKDLSNLSQSVGTFLAGLVQPRTPIAVIMDKSIDTLSVFLGTVYSGCFYININPSQPISRIRKILEVLKCEVIITDSPEVTYETLNFIGQIYQYNEIFNIEIDSRKLRFIRSNSVDTDPLYCNFTSGTTGTPKGVLVSHRSVIDFLDYFPELFDITHEDIIGNQAPFDFDVSVKDIYTSIKTGATLVIIPKSKFSFVTQLIDYIDEHKITTLIWAVSALCLLVDFKGFKYKTPSRVNKVLFSGEIMPMRYLNEWRSELPNAKFINLYGPTEITCNCTYYRVEGNYNLIDKLPIGKPFPNEKIMLLDENDREIIKRNVSGEICVGGSCLALGYYNNHEQTQQKFVQSPINKHYFERIYRTGDLGYFDENDNLVFSGRLDFQIKHMGHRIELEEIESVLNAIEGVERSCCIYDEQKHKIIQFYSGKVNSQELVSQLVLFLPMYMIPSKSIVLDSLPLTENGKIDRKKLRSIYEGI